MAEAVLTRDLAAAQTAFDSGDSDASLRAHTRPRTLPSSSAAGVEAGHTVGDSSLQKAFVFAAFDGLCAVAALATAAVVAELAEDQAVLLLVGGTLALGVSATIRDYARYRATCNHYAKERSREMWELQNYREGEEKEMCELYVARGVSPEHARAAIGALASYSDVFVDLMMAQELGLAAPDALPWRVCAAAAAGFALWGGGTACLLVAAMRHHAWTFAHLAGAAAAGVARLSGALTDAAAAREWSGAVGAAWVDAAPVPLAALVLVAAAVSHSAVRRAVLPSRTQWWGPGVLPLTALLVVLVVACVGSALRQAAAGSKGVV